MYCPDCGEQTPEGRRFCVHCGSDVRVALTPPPGSIPPPPSRPGRGSLSDRPTAGRETVAATAFAPGDVFGQRFEVRALLGQGGMGAVYRVHDRTLGEECALKVMHPHLLGNARAVERFLQEARLSRRLQHPHIVRVHDIVQFGEWYGLSMELLEGRSLRSWLDELGKAGRAVPVETAHRITSQVLEALEYAHGQTIHRDIKPENIFLLGEEREFTVKLVDFGIAKALDREVLTSASSSLGTAWYMAPEQVNASHAVDARADLFAVGAVLYELLMGNIPHGALTWPSEERPELGTGWDELLRAALDRNPAQRPTSAAVMRGRLDAALRAAVEAQERRRQEEQARAQAERERRDEQIRGREEEERRREREAHRRAAAEQQREAEEEARRRRVEDARQQGSDRLDSVDRGQGAARPGPAIPAEVGRRSRLGTRGTLALLGLIVAAVGVPWLVATWARQQSSSTPQPTSVAPDPGEGLSPTPIPQGRIEFPRRPDAAPAPATAAPAAVGAAQSAQGPAPHRATATQGPQGQPPGPPEPHTGTGTAGLTWSVPDHWESQVPSSAMRRAQYRVPGPGGDGECIVFYFGPGEGGDPKSNALRWAAQFQPAGDLSPEEALSLSTRQVGAIPLLTVEISGTYVASGMMGGPSEPKAGWMLLGAVAEGPDANWFFKFIGPIETVEAQREAFEGLLKSLRKGA